jgi:hypothetical protein
MADLDRLKSILQLTRREVAKVIIGQDSVVEQALVVIITGNQPPSRRPGTRRLSRQGWRMFSAASSDAFSSRPT